MYATLSNTVEPVLMGYLYKINGHLSKYPTLLQAIKSCEIFTSQIFVRSVSRKKITLKNNQSYSMIHLFKAPPK